MKPFLDGPRRCIETLSDGRFHLKTQHNVVSPWIFIKRGRFRKCSLWQFWEEMFPTFDGAPYIPVGCQSCWKVVIRPKNVFELFMLYEVLKASDLPSKCGTDLRSYTPPYGGFVYCDSIDQGKEYFSLLQPMVAEQVSPETAGKMILKRGCTELDRKMPSDQWKLTEGQVLLERYLNDIFIPDRQDYRESEITTAFKMQDFIIYANSIGDLSWKQVVGENVKLSVECVTY